jgi:hypothetical protein
MFNYSQFYNAFVFFIYTHEPWVAFFFGIIGELLKELSLALATWFSWDLKIRDHSEPGEILMASIFCFLGLTTGIMMVYINDSPRLVTFAKLKKKLYNKKDDKDLHEYFQKRIKDGYKLSSKLTRLKYYFQLFIVQWIIPITLYTVSDKNYGSPNIQTPLLFRIDFDLFFSINLFAILIFWIWNRRKRFENIYIWSDNKKKFDRFHLFWASSFFIFTIPACYLVYHPPIMCLIGIFLLWVFYFPFIIWTLVDNRYKRINLISEFYIEPKSSV